MIAVADIPLESQSLESEHILKIRFKNAQNSWTAPTQAPKPADTKQMIHFAVLNGECLLLNNDIMCPAQLLWCRNVKKKKKKIISIEWHTEVSLVCTTELPPKQDEWEVKYFLCTDAESNFLSLFFGWKSHDCISCACTRQKEMQTFLQNCSKENKPTEEIHSSELAHCSTLDSCAHRLCHKYVNNFLSRDREH